MSHRPLGQKPHILILGGGYAGVYTALELEKEFRRWDDFT